MANIKSAEKRNRQNEKNRKKNVQVKSVVKTSAKKVTTAASSKEKNADTIKNFFKSFSSAVDSACRKGVIHWKTAARKKSRMAKKVNAATK